MAEGFIILDYLYPLAKVYEVVAIAIWKLKTPSQSGRCP